MRPAPWLRLAAIPALFSLACQSPPSAPPEPAETVPPLERRIGATSAEADLQALQRLGPRPMGSEAADDARAWLRGELEAIGLAPIDVPFGATLPPEGGGDAVESVVLHNLIAAIPGSADDVVLLAARYDTDPTLDAQIGASGPAAVLGLARALAASPLDRSVWVAFLEGDGAQGDDPRPRFRGSSALAEGFVHLDARRAVRLAVVVERVCGPGLQVSRDRLSDRTPRDELWASAAALGHEAVFPADAPFEDALSGHRVLDAAGLRSVVALVGRDADAGPGDDADGEADAGPSDQAGCTPDGVQLVGDVTLAALDRLEARWAKIDRHVRSSDLPALRLEQFPAERAAQSSTFNGNVQVVDVDGTRRLLTTSSERQLLQSSMELEAPHRLIDAYTQLMSLMTSLHPAPDRVFNIGLGGGVLSRFHLHQYEGSRVDSVDIDPVVIDLATRFFQVRDPRHTIHEGDGAVVLAESEGGFDAVWIDAFTPGEGVPAVFLGRDFIDGIPRKLDADGIVVANLWAADGETFDAVVGRYKRRFSHGIRVPVPGALNHIIAVGDRPELSCESLRSAYDAWAEEGIVELGPEALERCEEL